MRKETNQKYIRKKYIRPDYDVCTRNNSGNIKKNQTKFGSKWDETTKKKIGKTK